MNNEPSNCELKSKVQELEKQVADYAEQLETRDAYRDLQSKLQKAQESIQQVEASTWREAKNLLLAQQCKEPFYGSALYKGQVVKFSQYLDKLAEMFEENAIKALGDKNE